MLLKLAVQILPAAGPAIFIVNTDTITVALDFFEQEQRRVSVHGDTFHIRQHAPVAARAPIWGSVGTIRSMFYALRVYPRLQ